MERTGKHSKIKNYTERTGNMKNKNYTERTGKQAIFFCFSFEWS